MRTTAKKGSLQAFFLAIIPEVLPAGNCQITSHKARHDLIHHRSVCPKDTLAEQRRLVKRAIASYVDGILKHNEMIR